MNIFIPLKDVVPPSFSYIPISAASNKTVLPSSSLMVAVCSVNKVCKIRCVIIILFYVKLEDYFINYLSKGCDLLVFNANFNNQFYRDLKFLNRIKCDQAWC